MRFYVLAPWAWDSEETKWRAPVRNRLLGLIDLRSLPQQATPISAGGFGFFAYSEPVSIPGAIELGSSLDDALTTAKKREVERAIRREGDWDISFGANTVREILAEFLTVGADPTGQRFARPLLSEEIHLGGHSIVWRGNVLDSPIWQANVLSVYQQDFQRLRQESGDVDHHRRVLGALDIKLRRYGIRAGDIAPDLEPLPPSTIITESFNKADSGTLGPDLSWTEINGAWEVFSNQAASEGINSVELARADTDLSSADHYGQVIVTFLGGGTARLGGAARIQTADGTTITCYYADLRNNDALELEKVVNGTDTELASTAQTVSLPDTVRVQADGSTIKSFFNGSEVDSVTDTAITGNLRAGLMSRNGGNADGSRGDDFEAADLVAGPTFSRSLSGSQPAATGTLVRKEQAVRAVAGSQPAATGTLTRIEKALRTLAGNQPNATGVLTRIFGQPRTVTGNQPAASGTLARKFVVVRTLTGNQPAATGTLGRVYKAVRTVAGSQPAAVGVLVRIEKAIRTLTGSQPAGTGTLTRVEKALRTLTGVQPSATGTLIALILGAPAFEAPVMTARGIFTITKTGRGIGVLTEPVGRGSFDLTKTARGGLNA